MSTHIRGKFTYRPASGGQKALRLLLASVSSVVLATQAVQAQQAVPDTSAVETVVVTADRRLENAQSVPVTLTALSADTLLHSGIDNIAGITAAVPGLEFTQNLTGGTPFIRGVGTTSALTGQEGSVAVYVDDVYIAAPSGTLFSLNNIDRLEVLKGPQGTLYGRNATGGVVRVITRTPSQDASGQATIGYSNYNTIEGTFYGTAGLADGVAADLAVYGNSQLDGWGKNLTTGKDAFSQDNLSVRSKLLWNISDQTSATLAVDYSQARNELGQGYHPLPGTIAADHVTKFTSFYDTAGSPNDDARTQQGGVSLNIDQDLSFAQLKSISAYRLLTVRENYDQDATPPTIAQINSQQREATFTQELQLLSPTDSKITWIIGGYYFGDTTTFRPVINKNAVSASIINSRQGTGSYSAFGQATAPLPYDTNLTAGIRFTRDNKDVSGTTTTLAGMSVPIFQKTHYERVTYRLSLDHHFTDDIMGYASFNTGFKSGIFNTIVYSAKPVRPENIKAYEIGLKSELFDHRLRLNVSAFYYDYRDIQLAQILAGTSILINAARAEIKGIDADFDTVLTDNLHASGGFSILDGTYTSFPNAPTYVLNPAGGATLSSINATGFPTVDTPKFTFSSLLSYTHPVSWGELAADLSYSYNDGFNFSPDKVLRQPSYQLVGLSLGWSSSDTKWGVRVFSNNLLNEHYYTNMKTSTLGFQGSPAEPLTYGIRLTTNF
ncbi:MAG: TonB-dependent receptor [Rhizomicrobium sp.]